MLLLNRLVLPGTLLLCATAAHAGPRPGPTSAPASAPASAPVAATQPVQLTRVKLRLHNNMGALLRLVQVRVSLDGALIYQKSDHSKRLDRQARDLTLFDGAVFPGNHTVSVMLVYRGTGLGLFSYVRAYIYRLRSSHTLRAPAGQKTTLTITGYKRGNIFWRLEQRPSIRFEVRGTPGKR